MPHAILIGGTNGAGKTTFAREFLRPRHLGMHFLNADEIQQESSRFVHPVAAGRELLQRLAALESSRADFAVESTLSSMMYARKLSRWRLHGYETTLHFIELPSADAAVDRVASRAAAGGHAVPEQDIRRRFRRGLELLEAVYKPLPDRWYHWYGTDGGLHLVEHRRNRR